MHTMMEKIMGGFAVSVQDLMAVADETAQMFEYSNRFEMQSDKWVRTASQLRRANDKLTRLSVQKDTVLSQISHELRTQMTSILTFAKILCDKFNLSTDNSNKHARVIHKETLRITQLLDDLLDSSVLENGKVTLNISKYRD